MMTGFFDGHLAVRTIGLRLQFTGKYGLMMCKRVQLCKLPAYKESKTKVRTASPGAFGTASVCGPSSRGESPTATF